MAETDTEQGAKTLGEMVGASGKIGLNLESGQDGNALVLKTSGSNP